LIAKWLSEKWIRSGRDPQRRKARNVVVADQIQMVNVMPQSIIASLADELLISVE